MDKLLITIEEILRKDCRVQPSKGSYQLVEEKEPHYPSTKLKQKGKLLLYQLDRDDSNDTIFWLFNAKVKSLTTICDYLIFYPYKAQLFVFLCELGSTKSSGKAQLESGLVLAKFIVAMLEKHLKTRDFDIQYRGIVLSMKKQSKPLTNIKGSPYTVLSGSDLKKLILEVGKDIELDNLCK